MGDGTSDSLRRGSKTFPAAQWSCIQTGGDRILQASGELCSEFILANPLAMQPMWKKVPGFGTNYRI